MPASGKYGLSGWVSFTPATMSAGDCDGTAADVLAERFTTAVAVFAGAAARDFGALERAGARKWRGEAAAAGGSAPFGFGAGSSRTTSVALLSSRSPWNDGCRSAPSSLHSVNAI